MKITVKLTRNGINRIDRLGTDPIRGMAFAEFCKLAKDGDEFSQVKEIEILCPNVSQKYLSQTQHPNL